MAIRTTSTANFDETHLMLATLISRPVTYQYYCFPFVLCYVLLSIAAHPSDLIVMTRTESGELGSYLIDSGGIGSCRIDVHRSESERSKGDRTIQDLTQRSLRSEPQLIETSMIASGRISLNRNPTGPSCMEHLILLLRCILRHSKRPGRC